MTRAGAGAGKTTGLVARVIEVFEHFRAHGETPRIVLTTFTRKATQELKERLIARACQARDADLLQFASDPSRLQIATIHGLMNTFLRQVGHLAGLDAGFQIVSEGEARHLARLALREVVVESGDALTWLETYGFDRVLEMCRRFEAAWREAGELKAATHEDLRAAAHEEAVHWRRRLTRLAEDIGAEVPRPKWREYATSLKDFVAGWDGDCASINLPKKPSRSKKEPELDGWHDRIEAEINDGFKKEMGRPCWNRALWPDMLEAWTNFDQLARAYVARVDRIKEAQARFEMSDLELKSMEILRNKPFLGAVFAENWDYWMIDEYQDTSPLQVACLKALIGDRPRYFVGDPQQSIYLFRGAEVGVFDEAEREVTTRGGQVRASMRNWRSRPDLLHFINDFMTDIGDQFAAMEPREPAGPPSRECARLIHAVDGDAEMAAVVSRVGELVAEGARLEQICILGRTHRNLMDASRALKDFGFPTHVHSSRGFNSRREVIDAQALWKFLINPHDNLSLITLLRSPWYYAPDWQIAEWMSTRPPSLWASLNQMGEGVPEPVSRLRAARAGVGRDGLVRTFETSLLEASYLDLSLANDPAGRKESNLWKLILKARALEKEGGASALDFLSDGAGANPLDAAEGDAASAQEPNCINLMTIHGAKGLEFDHVILPAAGEAPRLSPTPVLAARGSLFFFPTWDDAEGKFTPSPLDYVANRERGRRETTEFDRWLYVALTRAKESLTVVSSEPHADSWAARSRFCRQPTGEYAESAYRYRVTDAWPAPAPYRAGPEGARAIRPAFGSVFPAAEERRSVTELVEKKKVGLKPEGLIKRWRAQNTGTRIHRALEALKYGRGADVGEYDEALAFVTELDDPPMRELIAHGETEWGFQVQSARGIIEGQIDLWAKLDGRLYVIDYKSGSEAYKEEAFTQLQIYAWALRRFGHAEPARLVVIYPLSERVETRDFTPELFARWEGEFGGA